MKSLHIKPNKFPFKMTAAQAEEHQRERQILELERERDVLRKALHDKRQEVRDGEKMIVALSRASEQAQYRDALPLESKDGVVQLNQGRGSRNIVIIAHASEQCQYGTCTRNVVSGKRGCYRHWRTLERAPHASNPQEYGDSN